VYDQIIDGEGAISYLGVILESTEEWNKHKSKQMVKGNQFLAATDKCLTRTPDMKVKFLENVYEILYELSLVYGAEVWELEEGWKEIRIIQGRFCKKVLRIPRFTANGVVVGKR
jgi:hypothetical protein